MGTKRIELEFNGILSNEISDTTLGVAGQSLTFELYYNGKPFTEKDGICFLTKVGGNLDNKNIYAHAKLNNNGEWIFELLGGGTEGAVRCMLR